MSASTSRCVMLRRLSRREIRVIAAGAAVSAVAVLVSWVVVPQLLRWSEREALIDLRTDQLARLQEVVVQEEALNGRLADLESEWRRGQALLLSGGTRAVAGSALQLLLNRYVAEAGMELERVDALGPSTERGALREVPARLTVRGDLSGLLYLLVRVQEGDVLLAVDELRVSAIPGPAGTQERIAATLALHGYARTSEMVP